MITRAILLFVVVAVAAFLVWGWERRPRTATGLSAGITVVTATDCRLCPLAIAAASGSTVPITIVDIGDLADRSIRSVPTAMVVDGAGNLVASRSGRSAVTDMSALIDMAEAFT